MNSFAADASGNTYCTGGFGGTVDFDPGSAAHILTSQWRSGYVLKRDSAGNFAWVIALESTAPYCYSEVYGISIDPSGFIYLTGTFTDLTDFDPGPGINTITPSGLYDLFVLKLDFAGHFIWAKTMGGSNALATGIAITQDVQSNLYLTGWYKWSVDFDPGQGTYSLLYSGTGSDDVFIEKLDIAGNFLWIQGVGGTDYDDPVSIRVGNDGNIYTSGIFYSSPINLGPFSLSCNGTCDIYITKLDGNGNFIWAKSFGGDNSDWLFHMTTDGAGNILLCGYFNDTVDFDPGPGIQTLIAAGIFGFADAYVLKLSNSGNFVWVKSIGGENGDGITSVNANNSSGDVYMIGTFQDTIDVDPGPSSHIVISNGSYDNFIVKLNGNGDFVWGDRFGGTMADDLFASTRMALGSDGYHYVSGLTESPQFGFDNSTTLVNPDYRTAFVAKIDSVISTGVSEIIHGGGWLSAYPNPARNEIVIQSAELPIISIKIYNIQAELVFSEQSSDRKSASLRE